MRNIPRASIHVGKNKKSFSAQVSNEAERRGWNESRYQQKNAEKDKNNHYNFSRKHLNFEIAKGGKIMPLGSNPIPLHERLQHRFDELGFKPYTDVKHPGQASANSPNCTVGIIFSGDHDVMHRLAFGDQQFDSSDANADQSNIVLQQGIYDWAIDTYRFACQKWGEENVIGFDVHCDETSVHAHVQTIPVEKVKKRGRAGSLYINKENQDIKLSTKEWKALSKDERDNYFKTTASKGEVERVSYARVWGERAKDKSAYLSKLHTDYHDEVGYKYGLERGIPYYELSPEERWARRHKDKVTLEAERQAKVAIEEAVQAKLTIDAETKQAAKTLEKVETYAVLATIDKKELIIPTLEINQPIRIAKEAVVKELGIPIPTLVGQKTWRETRIVNINAAIDALDAAIKQARQEQNESVRSTMNKTYTYYMQHLKTLIDNNKALQAENEAVKKENDTIKKRISQLDEYAVARVTKQKDSIIDRQKEDITSLKDEISSNHSAYELLKSEYNSLVSRWNALWNEPEFNDANEHVRMRKARETAERIRQEEAQKREEQGRQTRYQSILDMFINEGRDTLHAFAKRSSTQFTQEESAFIYYGIMATAVKHGISLTSSDGVSTATSNFLARMSWDGCTEYHADNINNWTRLFAEREVEFGGSLIHNFLSFIDFASCNVETYNSLGGSNGCAGQLTNWDGTKKRGLEAPETKKARRISM